MGAEVRRMQPEAQECPEPAAGWGRLADLGFDVIQTDWPGLVKSYLLSR